MKKLMQVHNTVDGYCYFLAQCEFDDEVTTPDEFYEWVREIAEQVPDDERGHIEVCDEGAKCFYIMATREDGTVVMGPRHKFAEPVTNG